MATAIRMTHKEWLTEGERRFGTDHSKWKFVCPSCGHIQSVEDYKKAGAPQEAVAVSCVGRWLPERKQMGEKPGPCNYAGYGLFRINPITVTMDDGDEMMSFAFAENV